MYSAKGNDEIFNVIREYGHSIISTVAPQRRRRWIWTHVLFPGHQRSGSDLRPEEDHMKLSAAGLDHVFYCDYQHLPLTGSSCRGNILQPREFLTSRAGEKNRCR